ncbi:PQQ-dependent sugar dehydrogenase [Steroidobacter sp. S1-65]|uniref:PQQ-dependent sugar dehydrogenase n=1 Tax=Steroidobacter gossypii TaxID=2805490 RepID=A0ABS1WXH3_9GAMM|nr:PQQ-dependent sugar dehydrogenase [Steroidobacter gossypii]MBM0105671.1 PQQ-dependent sugar dehydrogenase [Steroidobacter gossypii]
MQLTYTHSSLLKVATLSLLALCAACSREAASPAPAGNGAASADAPAGAPLETRDANGKDYKPAFAGQTRAPGVKSDVAIDVTVVAKDLKSAWAFEFLPDERILVTEREGNLRIVGKDGAVSAPLKGLPKVYFQGQGGLLDVAIDPQFASNRTIYWTYAEPREGGNGTALAKGVLSADDSAVEKVQVIFRQMPTFESNLHFGSRIVFTPDGKLFLALGERSVPEARVQSQDLNSHFGKVVRLNLDGSVPEDNPFVGRNDAKPEIWSYGHRNIQAAALDASGTLWVIEHGPRGGDELNQPQAGLNYGWPVITYGIEYSGPKIGEGLTAQEGMEQPVYYWDPVIAPSGMIVYDGSMFPEWQGNIFVGGLASMRLVRLQMQDGKVAGEEWLLQDRGRRIRDVRQGPDGAIYVVTEAADGELLKISRKS